MRHALCALPFLALILCVFSRTQNAVKITLFYEATCPHSVRFIKEQLTDAHNKIPNFIQLELVPFGRTQVSNLNGVTKYICKGGDKNCYANKIHACALEQGQVKGNTIMLDLLNCLLYTQYEDQEIFKCCHKTNYDYSRLKRCMISMVDGLMTKHAVKTQSCFPSGLEFVPVILIDDHFNKTLDLEATENLMQTVCKFLHSPPAKCRV